MKKAKTPKLTFTNLMIEKYLYLDQSVATVRACPTTPATSKKKLFQLTFSIARSPAGMAYIEAKNDLIARDGSNIDMSGNPQARKVLPYDHPEFAALLAQDSGICVEMPVLSVEEFEGVSELDISQTSWVFDWKASAKEVEEQEALNRSED